MRIADEAEVIGMGDRHQCWSRLHGWPGANAREPCNDILVVLVDRLTDLGEERDEAVEQDVGEREPLATEEFPAIGHLAVQPLETILSHRFQAGRSIEYSQAAAL